LAGVRELDESSFNDRLSVSAQRICELAIAAGTPRPVLNVAAHFPLGGDLEKSLAAYADVARQQGDSATAATLWKRLAAGAREASVRQAAFAALLKQAEEGRQPPVPRVAGSAESTPVGSTDTIFEFSVEPVVFSRPGARRWLVQRVSGDRLFVPETSGRENAPDWVLACGRQAMCCRRSDGHRLWSVPLAEAVEWAGGNREIVVIATESTVCAFDVEGGALRWWRPTLSERSSPQISIRESANEAALAAARYEFSGDTLLVLDGTRAVVAFDVANGEPRWRYRTGVDPTETTECELIRTPGEPFRRPGGVLRPFWCVREDMLAVQTERPSQTLFFDVEDGFLRETATPQSHDWIADPVTAGVGPVWAVGVCDAGLHQLDAQQGRVTLLQSESPYQGVRRAFFPGDHPVGSGEQFLAFRDGISLELRSTLTGQAQWRRGFRVSGATSASIAIGSTHLFTWSQEIARSYSLSDGRLAWEQPLAAGTGQRRLALVEDRLLAWPTKSGRATAITCLGTATGQLQERWVLPGTPSRIEVALRGSEVIVLANDTLSMFQIEPGNQRF
ncbi:MAG: hypothetical protein EHM42_09045, partial [Planctomycetaceae bacterium]